MRPRAASVEWQCAPRDGVYRVLATVHNIVNLPAAMSRQQQGTVFHVGVTVAPDDVDPTASKPPAPQLSTSFEPHDISERDGMLQVTKPKSQEWAITPSARNLVQGPSTSAVVGPVEREVTLVVEVNQRVAASSPAGSSTSSRLLATAKARLDLQLILNRKIVTLVVGTTVGQLGISFRPAPSDTMGFEYRLRRFVEVHHPPSVLHVAKVVRSVSEEIAFTRCFKRFHIVDYRTRVKEFLELYQPRSLHHLDVIMREWLDREEELVRSLVLKYGPEPRDIPVHQRLTAFVQARHIRDIHVDSYVSQHAGAYEEMFYTLRCKYGDEPSPKSYLFPAVAYPNTRSAVATDPIPIADPQSLEGEHGLFGDAWLSRSDQVAKSSTVPPHQSVEGTSGSDAPFVRAEDVQRESDTVRALRAHAETLALALVRSESDREAVYQRCQALGQALVAATTQRGIIAPQKQSAPPMKRLLPPPQPEQQPQPPPPPPQPSEAAMIVPFRVPLTSEPLNADATPARERRCVVGVFQITGVNFALYEFARKTNLSAVSEFERFLRDDLTNFVGDVLPHAFLTTTVAVGPGLLRSGQLAFSTKAFDPNARAVFAQCDWQLRVDVIVTGFTSERDVTDLASRLTTYSKSPSACRGALVFLKQSFAAVLLPDVLMPCLDVATSTVNVSGAPLAGVAPTTATAAKKVLATAGASAKQVPSRRASMSSVGSEEVQQYLSSPIRSDHRSINETRPPDVMVRLTYVIPSVAYATFVEGASGKVQDTIEADARDLAAPFVVSPDAVRVYFSDGASSSRNDYPEALTVVIDNDMLREDVAEYTAAVDQHFRQLSTLDPLRSFASRGVSSRSPVVPEGSWTCTSHF